MKLTTSVQLPEYPFSISHKTPVFLIGSCFTKEIGSQFQNFGMNATFNPFGTVYNPASIAEQLKLISTETTTDSNLFEYNYHWYCLQANTTFSAQEKNDLTQQLHSQAAKAKTHLQHTEVSFITLGTANAFVLQSSNEIVANCHKLPAKLFYRNPLTVTEIVGYLQDIIEQLMSFNETMQIVFTVSPIRHLRDGLVENTRSKARLHAAIDIVLKENLANVHYFPSYEIVLDELRDYRFYAEDLAHLNTIGIQYIWQKLSKCLFSSETISISNKVEKYRNLMNHMPTGGKESEILHQQTIAAKKTELLADYPFLKL